MKTTMTSTQYTAYSYYTTVRTLEKAAQEKVLEAVQTNNPTLLEVAANLYRVFCEASDSAYAEYLTALESNIES